MPNLDENRNQEAHVLFTDYFEANIKLKPDSFQKLNSSGSSQANSGVRYLKFNSIKLNK